MRVSLVGHGPSLLSQQRGRTIDKHDFVVRQKRCSETLKYPDQYGARTDFVCGSFTIANLLPADVPGCEYWVFVDSRHAHLPDSALRATEQAVPCTILKNVCDTWNGLYRERRTPYTRPNGMQEFDPLGHPHLSAGFHTILYTCAILKPDSIDLFGFDNMESGSFTWSVTRGPEWDKYPDHRWDIEHRMVPEVAEHYGVEIRFA